MIKKLLLAVTVIGMSAYAFAADASPQSTVYAYYFHGTMRCPTCRKLEQYSKEVIERNFALDLASGGLAFKVVNVEERENEHYVKEYNLYTKSLVLSKVIDGKEISAKNLDKIWEYVGNKQKFSEYVTREIREFLKGS
jgi:hypothetical protein